MKFTPFTEKKTARGFIHAKRYLDDTKRYLKMEGRKRLLNEKRMEE